MLKTKKQIKETWNKIAKEYGGYRRKPWPLLENFLDNVDSDLLDIGCGNCSATGVVLKKGVKLYGVDFSKDILKHTPKGVITIEADATKIPLKRKFKYIVSIGMLHHLPTEKDRIAFLKEVKRLLAKEGEAMLTVWHSKYKGDTLMIWGVKYKRYYHMFSKKELKELLDKVGFKEYKILLHSKTTHKNYIIKIKK
ncbi:class I SAM-dependent methyltransferase [Candidatus Woesearchaeota archaeon]|jgi:cyclopropane fatty-acyl-phospholipid synthase-like methyltransferase|nr:class I SAM-dependent methyltransferase [Candidatus Woesearchaeota archaeon]MBT7062912.1 class I SAM-dependent methyltransferase [Candidatus Woesearchaeota archaeon]MBT7402314.1 class I SAM-dependent methyltransferase [Candidatus Woesearchaeota archaeon]